MARRTGANGANGQSGTLVSPWTHAPTFDGQDVVTWSEQVDKLSGTLRWPQKARVTKSLLAFEGPALERLESILPTAVDSWEKLRISLLERFLPSYMAHILDMELQTLQQRREEPLRAYLDMFARMVRRRVEFGGLEERPEGEQKVEGKLVENWYLTTFVQGLGNEVLKQKLLTTYPLSFEVSTTTICREDQA